MGHGTKAIGDVRKSIQSYNCSCASFK